MTAKTNHDTPMVRDYRGVLMVPLLTQEAMFEKDGETDWVFVSMIARTTRMLERDAIATMADDYRFLEAQSTTHYNSDRTSVRIVTHVIGQRKPPVDKRWGKK